jgi:hypothetical protein
MSYKSNASTSLTTTMQTKINKYNNANFRAHCYPSSNISNLNMKSKKELYIANSYHIELLLNKI